MEFEGEYLDGKKWKGNIKEYDKNKRLIFEGEYLNGKRWNGKGKVYKNGFLIFEGVYLNGERWNGKAFDYDKEKKFEIEYSNGKIINRKEYENKITVSFIYHNQRLIIFCFPDEKINSVCERFLRKFCLDPFSNLKYICNGRILNGALTINSAGISNNDQIFVIDETLV